MYSTPTHTKFSRFWRNGQWPTRRPLFLVKQREPCFLTAVVFTKKYGVHISGNPCINIKHV